MRPGSSSGIDSDEQIEEYELPCSEAVLAGTLALMTGYGQALQAERDPAQRLAMSLRIAHNLERLADQTALSAPFRALSGRLSTLWHEMARCTAEAQADSLNRTANPAGCPGRRHLH